MRVYERNYPLSIGIALGTLFTLLAVFGPTLAPHDPMEANTVVIVGGESYIPPLRPFTVKGFPLGSDEAGRDLLSRIVWGIRPTLLMALLVVAARVAVGVPLGLMAGWYRGPTERIIDAVIGVSLAIPMLVFSLAVISFLRQYDDRLIVYVVALALIGWADTAAFVKHRALTIGQAPYIESARAIGVKPSGILWRYVLPQLSPVLPTLIAFELGSVTLLVAELGFLGVYIGGGFIYEVARGDTAGTYQILTSGYPELGQLLSDVWAKIIIVPWAILFVGSVIFVEIFAFNMLGEGLRRHMDVPRPRRGW
ncbi:MAG: ABC transporter permease [Ardenticatenaceae bacterium]|nr:ABC transporter permease [Ardenticatenaceae bacterium]HBY98274.1 hypothetical protein [Chloroflexota bacterium]